MQLKINYSEESAKFRDFQQFQTNRLYLLCLLKIIKFLKVSTFDEYRNTSECDRDLITRKMSNYNQGGEAWSRVNLCP